jgi:hypothetical protein
LKQRIDAGPIAKDGVCSLRGKDIQRVLEEDFGADSESASWFVVSDVHLVRHLNTIRN